MRRITKLLTLLIILSNILAAQSIKLSVSTVDRGGGRSSGPTIGLRSSADTPAVHMSTGGGGYFTLNGGFIPASSQFTGTSTTVVSLIEADWNMVSVPTLAADYRKAVLFPSALSSAFAYRGSYQRSDTLIRGIGYWLKFELDTTLPFLGASFSAETIAVADKWNM